MWYIRNTKLRNLYYCVQKVNLKTDRFLNCKIPKTPTELPNTENHNRRKIDAVTISHLERLSLVDFGNEKGIKILEDAIEFADQITSINTDGVEPLVTVLEKCELRLREDVVTDGDCRKEILSNASIIEEDYFVAPPGNIPVVPKTYETEEIKKGRQK